MVIVLDCASVHFNNIKSGRKIYEGRPNKSKYDILSVGQIIPIHNSDNMEEKIFVKITSLETYFNFKDMIDDKGIENVLPDQYDAGFDNEMAVNNVYRTWYSEDVETTYGVLCIGVEVI